MSLEVTTADGLSLFTRSWADVEAPHGAVLVVHGLGEHSGRYEHVAQALNRAGWEAFAYDQRGHGRSPGKRGDVADGHSLLEDLSRVIDALRARPGGRRLVLLGHSLGGLVTGRFVAEGLSRAPAAWSRAVEGLVMSSPPIDPGLSGLQKALLAVVPRVAPHLCVGNGLQPDWISRDPAVVEAYVADPLVHDRISGLLGSFVAAESRVLEGSARAWTVPTLLMWAGADRCVDPDGSRRFASAAPAGIVSSREWPALAHEILNEPEREEVLSVLLSWLDRLAQRGTAV